MTLRRFVGAALVAAVVLAGCGDDVEKPATSGKPAPVADPRFTFNSTSDGDLYLPPAALSGAHGDVIRAEKQATSALANATAWKMLYLSQSAGGRLLAVSGMAWVPTASATVPRPVIAWAHGTVGSADVCAPSKQSPADSPGGVLKSQLQDFIDKGYVVTATDYEGLGTPGGHTYLVGVAEGQNVLDSILAARALPGAKASDQALVYGLSQGGQAALFAGQLAASYTPSIKLAGVVAAAPLSEVDLLLPIAASLSGSEGYFVLAAHGLKSQNGALDLARVLRPDILAQSPSLVETRCLADVQNTVRTLANGQPVTVVDPLSLPDWRDAILAMKPGTRALGVPVLMLQGETDTTVPAFTTRTLVERMCKNGDKVTAKYYPLTGHGDSIQSGNNDLRSFVADRLAGKTVAATC